MGFKFCTVADCINPARKGGLCWAHNKRKARGTPMSQPLRARLGSWDAVTDAIHDYVDAPGEPDFIAASQRLRRAVKAWVFAREGRPT